MALSLRGQGALQLQTWFGKAALWSLLPHPRLLWLVLLDREVCWSRSVRCPKFIFT